MAAMAVASMSGQAHAQAQGPSPEAAERYGVYVEGGRSMRSGSATDALTLGFTWPFGGTHVLWGGAITPFASAFLSAWRAPEGKAEVRRSYTQLGASVGLRYRFAEGRSAWFAEIGTGISTLDRTYRTQNRFFRTNIQFVQTLSVGRNFGADAAHELSVGFQHFSNGGLRKPNPGENFIRARYQYRF